MSDRIPLVAIGDKIRVFCAGHNDKKLEIDFTSYDEGTVVDVEPPIVSDTTIWFRIEKTVRRNKELSKNSWRIGRVRDFRWSPYSMETYNKCLKILTEQISLGFQSESEDKSYLTETTWAT